MARRPLDAKEPMQPNLPKRKPRLDKGEGRRPGRDPRWGGQPVELEALPGWERFNETKQEFLRRLPDYNFRQSEVVKSLGIAKNWLWLNQARDIEFRVAIRLRKGLHHMSLERFAGEIKAEVELEAYQKMRDLLRDGSEKMKFEAAKWLIARTEKRGRGRQSDPVLAPSNGSVSKADQLEEGLGLSYTKNDS
jgi:hypothetical protein